MPRRGSALNVLTTHHPQALADPSM